MKVPTLTFNKMELIKKGAKLLFFDGGGGEIRTHDTLSGIAVFKTARFNHSRTPPRKFKAEEVGLEPTNRFLDGYSLANCWLTNSPHSSKYFNFTLKII
jgi:hypothetical protein